MYRSILVPLDCSPFAEHALPLAISIARRAKANLHLLVVHVPLAAVYGDGMIGMETTFDPRMHEMEQRYLSEVVERIKKEAPVQVSSQMKEGAVVTTIQDHAAAIGADLVVMTTHGRGPVGRYWLGSVADEFLRRSLVPVLLLRPQDGKADLTHDVPLRHMLMPLDGSPLAAQIIEPAIELGQLMEADYKLLNVVKEIPAATAQSVLPSDRSLTEEMKRIWAQQQMAAQEYVDKTAESIRSQGARVHTKVVTDPEPAEAILKEAVPQTTDVIALATHGRRGLPRLLFGSVADKLIRAATVPILVYRPRSK